MISFEFSSWIIKEFEKCNSKHRKCFWASNKVEPILITFSQAVRRLVIFGGIKLEERPCIYSNSTHSQYVIQNSVYCWCYSKMALGKRLCRFRTSDVIRGMSFQGHRFAVGSFRWFFKKCHFLYNCKNGMVVGKTNWLPKPECIGDLTTELLTHPNLICRWKSNF